MHIYKMIEYKEINKLINIKPRYFSRKEINELTSILNNFEEYIKDLELKLKNCKCNYLINENRSLKNKLNTIKINVENIEFDNKLNYNVEIKEKGMDDIIILLKEIKNTSNFIIQTIINILLFLLNYLYYLYILYNKKINSKHP
jgi:predicted RNase H-like nuclease (RuvC/YqgF family)